MSKGRLEAFSDGVIAIIITIMVLEMKVPHGEDVAALAPLVPVFLSYVLSFIYLGIYWNNHHHMLHMCTQVTGSVLWAKLHLLFGYHLFPLRRAGWAKTISQPGRWSLYGTVLLLAGLAYFILTRTLIAHHGRDSALATALGRDFKGKASLVCYAVAIPLAFVNSWVCRCAVRAGCGHVAYP